MKFDIEKFDAKMKRNQDNPLELYAIVPSHAPNDEVQMYLGHGDQDALDHAVFIAAKDIVDGNYFSPTADVYKVTTEGLVHVGQGKAIDAEWEWAHPAVDDYIAAWEQEMEAARRPSDGPPYFDMVDLRGFSCMFGDVNVEETVHVVALGPGLATTLSRVEGFNYDNPKEHLARLVESILESAKKLPLGPGEVGDIWSVRAAFRSPDGEPLNREVWAERLGDTNTATVFFPSER